MKIARSFKMHTHYRIIFKFNTWLGVKFYGWPFRRGGGGVDCTVDPVKYIFLKFDFRESISPIGHKNIC